MIKGEKSLWSTVCFLFWSIALAFIAENFGEIVGVVTHPSVLINALLTSELPTESNFAFHFGLFQVTFLQRKKWKYSLITFFFLALSFKRIAIAAVLVVAILWLLRKLFTSKSRLAFLRSLLIIGNCLVVVILFLFFNGNFDDFFLETFGVSTNFISQGRYSMYQQIFAHFQGVSFWGFGLGSINTFLTQKGYQLTILHSDVLKVFFELGPPVFLLWIYFFYKWARTFGAICLAIYINIIFLTDNVFIYFDVMMLFYILMAFAVNEDQDNKKLVLANDRESKE